MKKVVGLIGAFFLIAVSGFGQTLTTTATNPNPIPYVLNTQILATGSFTTTASKQTSFVDIKPLAVDGIAIDRTVWKKSDSTATISVPFVIYKAGTSTVALSAGETGCTVTNVWDYSGKTAFTDSYDIKITSNANIFPSGSYVKTLQFRQFGSNFTSWKLGDATTAVTTLTMTLTVSGSSGISLSVSLLNFGEVTTNATLPFSVTINSNQAFTLSMSSARTWKLDYWNTSTGQYAPITGENVAYEVLINGKTYSATQNPGSIDSKLVVASPYSYPYSGTVKLNTTTAATAGDYRDVLTFSVTSP